MGAASINRCVTASRLARWCGPIGSLGSIAAGRSTRQKDRSQPVGAIETVTVEVGDAAIAVGRHDQPSGRCHLRPAAFGPASAMIVRPRSVCVSAPTTGSA